jgi:uncharacterized SAM-binding protein YcdF (DUF218 family)
MKIIGDLLIKIVVVIALFYGILIGISFYLAPQDKLDSADAVVVVSGGETDLRTQAGAKIVLAGLASKLIVSGAAKEGPSNARTMKQIAIKAGVPENDIIMEEQAEDTFANARYSLEILKEHNWHKIILTTSPYHQRRAYLSFAREAKKEDFDLKIINQPAVDSAWRKNGWWNNEWARQITVTEIQKILFIYLIGN